MFQPNPFYEFPPFFTRQPNEDTWTTQRRLWAKVISQYCQEEGKWQVSQVAPVFNNPRIQRRLSIETIKEIFQYMCDEGEAERTGPSDIYVFKDKPVNLAYILSQWAQQSGNAGSVMTFYELTEGEYPGLDVFKNMDQFLLKKVSDMMVRKGEAAVMKEDNEIVGIKFA